MFNDLSPWQAKEQDFFDGFERGMGIIRRHGWSKARDMFNEQYPHDWKPVNANAWQHSKGYLDALMKTA